MLSASAAVGKWRPHANMASDSPQRPAGSQAAGAATQTDPYAPPGTAHRLRATECRTAAQRAVIRSPLRCVAITVTKPADSGPTVFLCIASARRELPLLPLRGCCSRNIGWRLTPELVTLAYARHQAGTRSGPRALAYRPFCYSRYFRLLCLFRQFEARPGVVAHLGARRRVTRCRCCCAGDRARPSALRMPVPGRWQLRRS